MSNHFTVDNPPVIGDKVKFLVGETGDPIWNYGQKSTTPNTSWVTATIKDYDKGTAGKIFRVVWKDKEGCGWDWYWPMPDHPSWDSSREGWIQRETENIPVEKKQVEVKPAP